MSYLPDQLQAKVEKLIALLKSYGSAAVAYSGGLDSAVLSKAAHLALGDKSLAITATSASLAVGELEEAAKVAAVIGISHQVIHTNEFENRSYLANTPERCYFCKYELFSEVGRVAKQLGIEVVIDGSNREDGQEHRPGIRAAKELHVKSPLAECGFCKAEIREVAAAWQLPIHNKPATPCLSSRIAYGQKIIPERLEMIDSGERYLREHGLQPLRVRYHAGDVARIEVPLDSLPKFVEPKFRKAVVDKLKAAGFKYVSLDLQGFRSGSLNEILPADKIELADKTNSRES